MTRMNQRAGSVRKSKALAIALGAAMLLVASLASPVGADRDGFLTSNDVYITIADGLPSGAKASPIISSGDEVGDFLFEGIPDGVGIRPGPDKHSIDVYVAHEQSVIPFRFARDFQSSSVSKLTLSTKRGPGLGSISAASVAIGPEAGFQRFCSAFMGGPADGLDDYVFFTGEETSDRLDGVQRGFNVVLNTETGDFTAVPGMGRLNHENTVIVPGGWGELAMLTTDDTFSAGTSQLYLYTAADQDAIFADEGDLWALRITGVDGVALTDPANPFNGANDYLDLDVGESFQGEFIPVPREVALGDQDGLEDWSNANNVMQFIRLEDVATDKNDPLTVYIADTGGSRIQPDPATGRMHRPAGDGLADNGRIFQMVMNANDPRLVDSLTILADGDVDPASPVYVPFTSPDNLDTSKKSLMVQEDTDNAGIWQHRLPQGDWRVVATVNDPDGESSGIVDASPWLGGGHWLLTVQAHGTNVDETTEGDITIKREDGQLVMLTVPGS
ncbi:MAG: PhoX family protein [Acidimicrobiia bacterium]|nr:PhoX family protein [Acidimicrobiia bacterium]